VGASPLVALVYEFTLDGANLFQHSNWKMPLSLERLLNTVLVTPRMHGIHHSVLPGEMNANWSSGLTLWDRLHRTVTLNVPQAEVEVGVPEHRRPEEVTLPRLELRSTFRLADALRGEINDSNFTQKLGESESEIEAAKKLWALGHQIGGQQLLAGQRSEANPPQSDQPYGTSESLTAGPQYVAATTAGMDQPREANLSSAQAHSYTEADTANAGAPNVNAGPATTANSPSSVPWIVPLPPKIDVPPSTTAVIANSS